MRSLFAAMVFIAFATTALAQAQPDHQEHHPGAQPSAQTQPPPGPPAQPPAATPAPQGQAAVPMGEMMQKMPEQCRAMMQNMPHGCMGMMQQMMQGGMMQPGMTKDQSSGAAAQPGAPTAGPTMMGAQGSDPDLAFVKSMIEHHRGAINMAKAVLQQGKDDQVKKWANDVLREQQREIDEMQAWLNRAK